jgi:chemotaxis protein histidine kinase CheA/ActR/RegA family two-component response regulator
MSIGALIEKFRGVALDRVERMNVHLVALERQPGDATAIAEILREIHTLKGEAKMMGFADVNLVAHQAESVLIWAGERGFHVNTSLFEVMFEGLDLVRMLLTKRTGANDEPIDLTGFVDRVQARLLEAQAASQGQAEGLSEDSSEVLELAKPAAPRPAARAQGEFKREGSEVNPGILRLQTDNTLRVSFDKLERLSDVASEVLLMGRRLEHQLGQVARIKAELHAWHQQVEALLPKSQWSAARELVHRLDLALMMAREESYMAGTRAAHLDDEVRRLRHVPLAQVISHYPRAIRDLAHSQGKRVRLVQDVGDVEIDRAILSALSDPLLHLVRNAVDHGLEGPEERQRAGKDAEGELFLGVEYVGDSLKVVLRDDGRGIDPERVKARAVARGMLQPEQAYKLTEQQAIALIFEPGFSTKEEVSDVSGRGLGMDIVLRQITSMGGVVEVDSEVGRGTRFILLIPLSSAVVMVLLVRMGERVFAIPAKDVERVLRVEADEVVSLRRHQYVRLDGVLVELVQWYGALGMRAPQRTDGALASMIALVVRKGNRRQAVMVEQVLGDREALQRPLGEFLQGLRMCRGVVLTDDGEVLPLLNTVELLAAPGVSGLPGPPSSFELQEEQETRRASWSTLDRGAQGAIRTILVAEDSEVTRALVSGILRGLGYRVLEARDGQEAWEMVQAHRLDLLITDIQMPRLDGLGLLRRVRASKVAEHRELPAIILSTLGSLEDREQGLQAGADAYLVKLDFREQDLIAAVQRYLRPR